MRHTHRYTHVGTRTHAHRHTYVHAHGHTYACETHTGIRTHAHRHTHARVRLTYTCDTRTHNTHRCGGGSLESTSCLLKLPHRLQLELSATFPPRPTPSLPGDPTTPPLLGNRVETKLPTQSTPRGPNPETSFTSSDDCPGRELTVQTEWCHGSVSVDGDMGSRNVKWVSGGKYPR